MKSQSLCLSVQTNLGQPDCISLVSSASLQETVITCHSVLELLKPWLCYPPISTPPQHSFPNGMQIRQRGTEFMASKTIQLLTHELGGRGVSLTVTAGVEQEQLLQESNKSVCVRLRKSPQKSRLMLYRRQRRWRRKLWALRSQSGHKLGPGRTLSEAGTVYIDEVGWRQKATKMAALRPDI